MTPINTEFDRFFTKPTPKEHMDIVLRDDDIAGLKKEVERLTRQLDYAFDDLAFLDKVREENALLHATLKENREHYRIYDLEKTNRTLKRHFGKIIRGLKTEKRLLKNLVKKAFIEGYREGRASEGAPMAEVAWEQSDSIKEASSI